MARSKPLSRALKPLTGVGSHDMLGLAKGSWREGRSSQGSERAWAAGCRLPLILVHIDTRTTRYYV